MNIIELNKGIQIKHNNGDIVNVEEIPITHEFADQIYIRKMVMQKGQAVAGAKHKHKHVWF